MKEFIHLDWGNQIKKKNDFASIWSRKMKRFSLSHHHKERREEEKLTGRRSCDQADAIVHSDSRRRRSFDRSVSIKRQGLLEVDELKAISNAKRYFLTLDLGGYLCYVSYVALMFSYFDQKNARSLAFYYSVNHNLFRVFSSGVFIRRKRRRFWNQLVTVSNRRLLSLAVAVSSSPSQSFTMTNPLRLALPSSLGSRSGEEKASL
ncbi:hypothetical protein F2Q70_00034848 [Brassica cretica]|uniref:Uncharacterized protein n=1 Tax=Brassica cretica TaxID=69181 RepID=A0A8S9GIQ0_BRACR|nr:hypothetical protein F2Q68_00029745 [Brassica cretica]KAF2586196.1 hypothetical protein F2Q70_00034848 [Brassica cretica]